MHKDGIGYLKLSVDGASRKNPGLAGAGLCLQRENTFVAREGFFLGIKTNNEAEYLALLIGIFYAKKHLAPQELLLINSDSQLLIRQIQGAYRVKDAKLIPLYRAAIAQLQDMRYVAEHVMREANVQADAMANLGVDKKRSVPAEVAAYLIHHSIQI